MTDPTTAALSPETSNLHRIQAIGSVGVRWLYQIGIQTLQELAQQSTDELVKRLRQQGMSLSAREVARWIVQAQQQCQTFPCGLKGSESPTSRPIPVFNPHITQPHISIELQPQVIVQPTVMMLDDQPMGTNLDTAMVVECRSHELETPPIADSTSEEVAEPMPEPSSESISEPIAESSSEPISEPIVESIAESIAEPIADSAVENDVESVSGESDSSESLESPETSNSDPEPNPTASHRTIAIQVTDTDSTRQISAYCNHANQMIRWNGDSLADLHAWLDEQMGPDPVLVEVAPLPPAEPIFWEVEHLEFAQASQGFGWMSPNMQGFFLTELTTSERFSLKVRLRDESRTATTQLSGHIVCETRHLETGATTALLDGTLTLDPDADDRWTLTLPNLTILESGLHRISLRMELANGAIAQCKIPALQVISPDANNFQGNSCQGGCECA